MLQNIWQSWGWKQQKHCVEFKLKNKSFGTIFLLCWLGITSTENRQNMQNNNKVDWPPLQCNQHHVGQKSCCFVCDWSWSTNAMDNQFCCFECLTKLMLTDCKKRQKRSTQFFEKTMSGIRGFLEFMKTEKFQIGRGKTIAAEYIYCNPTTPILIL